MFVFLNKTGFRGLYRVGPNGFNVPYGNYKKPEIVELNHLTEIHNLLQNVIFQCVDYRVAISSVATTDFMYLDPPYAPETATSFVKYADGGFTTQDHTDLFQLIHNVCNNGCSMIMSNAGVPFVTENFPINTYVTEKITCKRTINSKKPEATTTEVIIVRLQN
jgi:DNA adenine methylase